MTTTNAPHRASPVEPVLHHPEAGPEGTAVAPLIETWDLGVTAVRRGRWDDDDAVEWIRTPHREAAQREAAKGGSGPRAPAPFPDALARGLEGIAAAVAAALGIG